MRSPRGAWRATRDAAKGGDPKQTPNEETARGNKEGSGFGVQSSEGRERWSWTGIGEGWALGGRRERRWSWPRMARMGTDTNGKDESGTGEAAASEAWQSHHHRRNSGNEQMQERWDADERGWRGWAGGRGGGSVEGEAWSVEREARSEEGEAWSGERGAGGDREGSGFGVQGSGTATTDSTSNIQHSTFNIQV